ncbi:MAG: hypothetical protein ACI4WR_08405 [Bulleidia sp.]
MEITEEAQQMLREALSQHPGTLLSIEQTETCHGRSIALMLRGEDEDLNRMEVSGMTVFMDPETDALSQNFRLFVTDGQLMLENPDACGCCGDCGGDCGCA